MQDIEKLAPKKGVISQSVKDVLQVAAPLHLPCQVKFYLTASIRLGACALQSLVDDDMVHQDKIGISNFFW